MRHRLGIDIRDVVKGEDDYEYRVIVFFWFTDKDCVWHR